MCAPPIPGVNQSKLECLSVRIVVGCGHSHNYMRTAFFSSTLLTAISFCSCLASLVMSFKPFGSVKVEWPGKADGRHLHHPPKGKVYCYD